MEKKKHTQISANLAGAAAPASPNVATPLLPWIFQLLENIGDVTLSFDILLQKISVSVV
jgi:hypothetical protein